MSYATLNGRGVTRGIIRVPRIGVWTADVQLQGGDRLDGKVVLALNGKQQYAGTVFRAASSNDSVPMRIIGGAGALRAVLPPRTYQSVPLSTVLADLGESLSATIDSAVLSIRLDKWVRPRGQAAQGLQAVLSALNVEAWRVLPDGSLWLGKEAWPTVNVPYQLVDEGPTRGTATVWTDDVPTIFPGVVVDGRRVSRLEYEFNADRLRSHLWFEGDTQRSDGGVLRWLTSLFQPKIDANTLWPARVISQATDYTLEVKPDSDRLQTMRNVPIRLGVPDMRVKVQQGSRVLVQFEGGDMRYPVATLWQGATITEVQIGIGATHPIVVGDTYRSAEDTLLTALGTFATAIASTADAKTPSSTTGATAALNLNNAITSFKNAAASYLSTIAKVRS